MKHYIQYHYAERSVVGRDSPRGATAAPLEPDPAYAVLTNKPLRNLEGSCLWLICGEGRPRRYSFCMVFCVDGIAPYLGPGFAYRVFGERGLHLDPPIPLNPLPWFPHLLQSQYHFQFGLRQLTDAALIAALQGLLPADADLCRAA